MMKPSPELAGATEAFVHERASATSSSASVESTTIAQQAGAPIAASVDDLQRWFAAAVTDVRGLREGILAHGLLPSESALERVITRGPRLSAFARLGVYAHGYFARLEECLLDDYPAVEFAMGHAAFHDLCRAYVTAHPSRSPSLNFFGRHMADFLRSYDVEHREFLSELARLEWALVEVLHAAPAPTLSLEALGAVPPEQWTRARLPAADTVRLLRFTHPVNAFFQAFRVDEKPSTPAPAPSATAVYRHELTLWRLDLTQSMARLLESLFAGETLGDALSRVEVDDSDPEAMAEAERNVMAWFREWVAGGVFARIDVASE